MHYNNSIETNQTTMKLETLQTTDLLKIARFNKGEKRRQALEQMTDEQLHQLFHQARTMELEWAIRDEFIRRG